MKEESSKKLYDGFEGKELSDIWKRNKFEEGAVEFQLDIVRKGKQALKITINKGDKSEIGNKSSKTSERDELLEKKRYGPLEDKSYSYSFSIYIPEDFPIVSTRLVLAQWKQHDENDKAKITNPVLALRYQKGELFVTLQTTEERILLFKTIEEIKGKWIDFTFEVNFTRKKLGFIKIFMNKKQIVNYKGITALSEIYGYSEPSKFYFKMGLYRDMMDEPMSIYIDEFRKKVLKK